MAGDSHALLFACFTENACYQSMSEYDIMIEKTLGTQAGFSADFHRCLG